MNTHRIFQFAVMMALLVIISGCSESNEHENTDSADAEQPSRVVRGPGGQIVVTLDADTQKTMDLSTSTLTETSRHVEITGYGRVIDPAPLTAAAANYTSAKAAAIASEKELARLKTLASQENASARSLESAEAAAAQNAAQADSTRAQLLAVSGTAIVDRADLATFTKELVSGKSALVRIEVPPDVELPSELTTARIVSLASGSNSEEGKFLGRAATVDPATQNRGFLFVIETNAEQFPPGTAVTGFLPVSDKSETGVIVPREAVVLHQGEPWVYVRTDGTNFTRLAITLGTPLVDGWFVKQGVSAGTEIVVRGAQSVFSEELNGSGFLSGERD